jgi:hypothetical protein
MRFVVDVAPRFDYARARHEVALTRHGALFRSPELELSLSTRCPLEILDGADVRARVALRAGETATFVLDRVEPSWRRHGSLLTARPEPERAPSRGDPTQQDRPQGRPRLRDFLASEP